MLRAMQPDVVRSPRHGRTKFSPQVERLEQRDCPTLALTMSVAYGADRHVTLSGHVSNGSSSVAGAQVQFSGVATGQVTTDSNGSYSINLQASALGNVEAVASKTALGSSNAVDYTLASSSPTITSFYVEQMEGDQWALYGSIDDDDPGNVTIQFGGSTSLNSLTVNTLPDGTFWIVSEFPTGLTNMTTAKASDCWSLVSDTVYASS